MHTMSKSKTYSLTYAVAVMSVESWKGKKKGNKKRCLYIASGETRIAETRPVALLRHIRKIRVVSGISRIGHRGWS